MVKRVSSVMGDELHDQAMAKGRSIGLNRSQMVRYAFAIVCGYSQREAVIMAKMPPDTSLSILTESK